MGVTSHWFTAEGSGTVVFPFQSLSGDLVGTATNPERVKFPGVDGIGLYFDGLRGEPFTVETMCDFTTTTLAAAAHASYLLRVGTKLDLYYLGLLWGTVAVMGVRMKEIKQLGAIAGGINVADGSPGAILRATWKIETLIP